MTNFWYWLGNAASVIQILSAIPLLLTAWWFFLRARRYRRRIAEMEKTLTARPMALAIGVAGTDISGQVRQFLESAGMKMEVRPYTKEGGVTQKNIHTMLNEILRIKSRMTEDRVTEVHLFLVQRRHVAGFKRPADSCGVGEYASPGCEGDSGRW